MSEGYLTAEARSRVEIDRQFAAFGWVAHDRKDFNTYAGRKVVAPTLIMAAGHGRADDLLFKANLESTWLRGESVDDAASLPAPGVLAAEIVEELEAALAQFAELAVSLPLDQVSE